MTKIIGVTLILCIVLTACLSTKLEINDNTEDLEVDSEYYDSLRIKHFDFLKIFEVEAKLNPINGTTGFHVFRSIRVEALETDTLRFSTDYSQWNLPDSTQISDQYFWFEWEIALIDIDTSNIKFNKIDDIIWISIIGVEPSKAKWSKIDLSSGEFLWKVPSNEIRLAFLTSKDKIKNSFNSYKMYDPISKNQIDYVNYDADSILGVELVNSIKNITIKYTKNINERLMLTKPKLH